jgi:Acyl-CoA dehydrogenase, C-terminal domain
MDASERELFARSVGNAMELHTGPGLDAALAALGWTDALDADASTAVATLFELQGRARVTSRALDDVLGRALGADRDAGVVLPALGAWRAPGAQADGRIAVSGLATPAIASTPVAVVVAGYADDTVAYLVAIGDLDLRPIEGVDPALGLVAVTGAGTPVGSRAVDWRAAIGLGQLALGHELVGMARTMLELAREHAVQRVQFGRPIAMFQAIRHRLAEALVAIEAAEAVLGAAWEDGSATSAAIAKASAGRAARTTSRHCQQVLAGIGFTTEHPFQAYARRVLVLDQLLGSTRGLTADLGRTLLAQGALPPLLPL